MKKWNPVLSLQLPLCWYPEKPSPLRLARSFGPLLSCSRGGLRAPLWLARNAYRSSRTTARRVIIPGCCGQQAAYRQSSYTVVL